MEKRYAALRTIGTIYKVLGIVVAAITVLLIIGFCLTSLLGGTIMGASGRGGTGEVVGTLLGSFIGTLIASVIMIIYGGAMALTLYAAGEGIYLMLAVEENTRMTAVALQGRSG